MPWLKIEFVTAEAEVERLGAALESAGAVSVTLEAADAEPLFDELDGATPLWRATRVAGLWEGEADPATVLERARRAHPAPLPEALVSVLADQDWGRVWMDRYRPMRYGARLWVCPSWLAPPDPGAINLRLDPGMAFGTGTHPTTGLCLEWLEARTDLAGTRVIDYGCGSGILAIAAALLGAAEVRAVDIDPQALAVTRENAAANGVADRLRVTLPEDMSDEPADQLVANILAGPLQGLAPRFAALVRPGGALCLSGLLAGQAEACLAAYGGSFTMGPPRRREEWVLLEGRRRVPPC